MSLIVTKPRTGAATAPAKRINRGLVLALACAAQAMVGLDTAIVNVALPSIQRDLGVGQSTLQWVVVAYGLLLGGFLLLGGRMTDQLGRRRVFLAGLTVFTGASFLAGVAHHAGPLIAARAVQGFGAALIAPAALSLLAVTFDEDGSVLARSASSAPWAGQPGRWGSSPAACWPPVALQIGALSGVSQAASGLASGLVETMREIGGAAGVAAVSTVLVAGSGLRGFHTAFAFIGVLAVIGVLIAATGFARNPEKF